MSERIEPQLRVKSLRNVVMSCDILITEISGEEMRGMDSREEDKVEDIVR